MPFVGICHMHVDSGLVQCRIEVESTPQMDDLVAIMANPCVPGVESLNVETKPAVEGDRFPHVHDGENSRAFDACDWTHTSTLRVIIHSWAGLDLVNAANSIL